jgi:acyl carrier protein phosphodiesterase
MNYLAHIFLSGTDDEIILGNFIGDYVKGGEYNKYPLLIKKGILLHRRIDAFTDRHKVVHQSMRYFAPKFHKYAGIIIDVLYDHFLITNWDKFSPKPLDVFKKDIFELLKSNYAILPERVQFFVSSFIQKDWIEIYSSIDGLMSVFIRMSMRTTLPDHSEYAREVLRKYYVQLESEFLTYFPDIIRYVMSTYEINIPLKDSNILLPNS